jgi:hypothetical protein
MSLVNIWDVQVFHNTITKLYNITFDYEYALREDKYYFGNLNDKFEDNLLVFMAKENQLSFQISEKESMIANSNSDLSLLKSQRYDYENKNDYITKRIVNFDGSVTFSEEKISYQNEIDLLTNKIIQSEKIIVELKNQLSELKNKRNKVQSLILKKQNILNQLQSISDTYFNKFNYINRFNNSIIDKGINLLNKQVNALNGYVEMNPLSSDAYLMGYNPTTESLINRLQVVPQIEGNSDTQLLLIDVINYLYIQNDKNAELLRTLNIDDCARFLLKELCLLALSPLGEKQIINSKFIINKEYMEVIKKKFPLINNNEISIEIYIESDFSDFDYTKNTGKIIFCSQALSKQIKEEYLNKKLNKNNITLIPILPEFKSVKGKIIEWRKNNYGRFK